MKKRSNEEKTELLPEANAAESNWIHESSTALLAIFLRLFSHYFLAASLFDSPEFVTPWSSFKRLREGAFLHGRYADSELEDPYSGNLFHAMPLMAWLLRNFLRSNLILHLLWAVIDLLTALCIRQFAHSYALRFPGCSTYQADRIILGRVAFSLYLLNPMTIGCWSVLSLSSIVNLLLAGSLLFTITDWPVASILLLAVAAHLNPYYLVLLAAIFVHFAHKYIVCALASAAAFGVLGGVNLLLATNPRSMFDATIGFFLAVEDLTPNVGLFWYFFTEVFSHFRLLFLCTFQMNALIYVLPLSATLRKNPPFLFTCLLIVVAIFSSYPSYAETAIYLPYLPLIIAFAGLQKFVRYNWMLACSFVSTFILLPITWRMWVKTASGNANFYFGMALAFNITQIFLFADLLSAYLRMSAIEKGGREITQERTQERMKLVSISPL